MPEKLANNNVLFRLVCSAIYFLIFCFLLSGRPLIIGVLLCASYQMAIDRKWFIAVITLALAFCTWGITIVGDGG